MHIHKLIDENDGVPEPIPGFVASGPQGYELHDGCGPAGLPATTYFDRWGCHSTNEPTLVMQAASLYLIGSLHAQLKEKP
jgi:endoglucanase